MPVTKAGKVNGDGILMGDRLPICQVVAARWAGSDRMPLLGADRFTLPFSEA